MPLRYMYSIIYPCQMISCKINYHLTQTSSAYYTICKFHTANKYEVCVLKTVYIHRLCHYLFFF